jgi:hypothetical protein
MAMAKGGCWKWLGRTDIECEGGASSELLEWLGGMDTCGQGLQGFEVDGYALQCLWWFVCLIACVVHTVVRVAGKWRLYLQGSATSTRTSSEGVGVCGARTCAP